VAELPHQPIIECHYDEDADDERREVQYYWGYSELFTGTMLYLTSLAVGTMQKRFQGLFGSEPVKHPFLEFGAPRDECPSERDPDLATKTIRYAPRVRPEPPTGPVAPPTKTTEGCPSDFYCRNRHFFEYGPVPEHFVPDWPDPLPADWVEIRLYLDEAFPGSVEAMVLDRLSMHHVSSWRPLVWQREGRNRDADLVMQDIDAARERNLPVVRCFYAGATVLFWYKEVDDLVGRDRLRSRVRDHPLLGIGDPIETCPPSREEALALAPAWRQTSRQ
jgi:hypothetical protein